MMLLGTLAWNFHRSAHADPASAAGFRVIVHSSNPAGSAERGFLADVFLKKVTRWPNGALIRPVDQRPTASVRRGFSEAVLKRTVAAVRSFWQQRIFSGRDLPPPELDSDDRVVDFVETHPGAVGYVSPNARLGRAREVAVK